MSAFLISVPLIIRITKVQLKVIIFCLITFSAYCQNPTLQWQKNYGGSGRDEAQDLLVTKSGSYVVVGVSSSSDGDIQENKGNVDAVVMKISSEGNLIWQKTLGGSDVDFPQAIIESQSGGYVIAGFTWSNDGDITENKGSRDCWIVELDSSGTIVWQKTYGGSGSEAATSICTTNDGGYIFAGWTESSDMDVQPIKGAVNYWVVKLSSKGDIQWQNTYGGNLKDEASSILETDDGYVIVGRSSSNKGDMNNHKGNLDYWVLKVSKSGSIMWQKNFGGSDGDYPFTIVKTSDNCLLIGGTTWSNDRDVKKNKGMRDFWIVKISGDGNLLWEKTYGGTSTDYLRSVVPTSDNCYLLCGWTDSGDEDVRGNKGEYDIWIVKIDFKGTIVWQKTFGGSRTEQAYAVRETNDKGCIIAGWTLSPDGDITTHKGGEDFWLLKLADVSTSVFFTDTEKATSSLQNTIHYNNTALRIYTDYFLSPYVTMSIFSVNGENFNLKGNVVNENLGCRIELNIDNLAEGFYVLQITDEAKTISYPFVKSKYVQ